MSIEQIMITLPIPPKMLNPNSRPHWRTKAQAVKRFRNAAEAQVWVQNARDLRWQRAVSQATFYWPCRRSRDIDNANAMLKPAFDGLRNAGLIVDDNSDVLTHEPTVFAIDAGNPRVELLVTKL